jgi:hypothetical protein
MDHELRVFECIRVVRKVLGPNEEQRGGKIA